MEFTLAIFYYLYLLLIGLFLLFSFFNYYHLIKFGFWSWGNWGVMIFYALVAVAIFLISWSYFAKIDWQTPLPWLNNIDWQNFLRFKLSTTPPPENLNVIQY